VHLQVTREDYFEAALTVLTSDGHHALKMGVLCKRLGVTTGSFYNYFGSWAEFTPDLLTYWESLQARRLSERTNAASTPARHWEAPTPAGEAVHHDAELAIRAWSNGDPMVATVQQRIDSRRSDALRARLRSSDADDERSELLTVAALSMMVGIQQLGFTLDIEDAIAAIASDDTASELVLLQMLDRALRSGQDPVLSQAG
jgi:AcrR family transcriptional regulator